MRRVLRRGWRRAHVKEAPTMVVGIDKAMRIHESEVFRLFAELALGRQHHGNRFTHDDHRSRLAGELRIVRVAEGTRDPRA